MTQLLDTARNGIRDNFTDNVTVANRESHANTCNAAAWLLWSNAVKPSGHYMYRQFNIRQFYVLPHTAVLMCFVWISEQTAIISLYSINWLVFVTEI